MSSERNQGAVAGRNLDPERASGDVYGRGRSLLTAPDQTRIDLLQSRDADGVPSATLASLLQAPFISPNRQGTLAVYGPDAAARRQNEFLPFVSAAGDTVPSAAPPSATLLLQLGG